MPCRNSKPNIRSAFTRCCNCGCTRNSFSSVKNSGATTATTTFCLTYMTGRGRWYNVSWKGTVEKSGGIATNIGIHFFDLLIWLFGQVTGHRVHLADSTRMAGFLDLERARVRWFLSVDPVDVPAGQKESNRSTYPFHHY